MRTISALAVILIGNCLVPSLQAKDIIMDKSPDGNFALRIHPPKEAGDQPKVGMINLLTEEAVLELDCHRCYENSAKPKLVWFSDSQRVAYYTPHPDGGYTQGYFRRSSSLEERQLPSIPNLPFPDKGRRTSKRSRPLVNRFDGSN